MFEVPQSIWKFQAIARELARQSELLSQDTTDAQDEQSGASHRHRPGAPNFDALTFQNNPLRFSPYSHQSFLPSQPWPQPDKRRSASSEPDPDEEPATTVAMPGPEEPLEGGAVRSTSVGPDDQLFEELNEALNEEAANMQGRNPSSHYLQGVNRITFDPHLAPNWSGMRSDPYQSLMQDYPQLTSPIAQQQALSSTGSLQQSSQLNNLTLLPSSSANPPLPPPPPQFIHHPKPQQPPPLPHPTHIAHATKPNIPGYYKSSLKLWSQEGYSPAAATPTPLSSRPMNPFVGSGTVHNSAYSQQLSYVGGIPAYPPPPQSLASSPVTSYTNYGGTR